MPYSSETFSTLSATTSYSVAAQASFNSKYNAYGIGGSTANKFFLPTDTNSTLAGSYASPTGVYLAGAVRNVSGTYFSYDLIMRIWLYSNDTMATSSTVSNLSGASSAIGSYNGYAISTAGTDMYFGSGAASGGGTQLGGLVKYASSTNTASIVYSSGYVRAGASGVNNESVAGYLAGGTNYATTILKFSFGSQTYSTIAATLSSVRHPARAGIQHGVCAYYGGGKNSGSSVATSVTTVDKLSYSTDTCANLASATVNRDGISSWNTLPA